MTWGRAVLERCKRKSESVSGFGACDWLLSTPYKNIASVTTQSLLGKMEILLWAIPNAPRLGTIKFSITTFTIRIAQNLSLIPRIQRSLHYLNILMALISSQFSGSGRSHHFLPIILTQNSRFVLVNSSILSQSQLVGQKAVH